MAKKNEPISITVSESDMAVREKTREELIEDLKELSDKAENTRKILERRERKADLKESADQIYDIYRSYIDAGFDEDKAFELVKMFLKNAFEEM